ncbi:hypothetical protein OsJ_28491 [Oryza sativa Japonica Group]|uniref:Uncharacterized protein n=1 Tax=Oryza sativa subsp. japonica TaxID=39947 RepID=A3BWD3_ORYSJ|nr:hypothetical protein OsJ_28491 [Oryza sativa Japonica Group]
MGSLAEIGGHLKLSCLLLQRQVEDDSNLGAVTLLFQGSGLVLIVFREIMKAFPYRSRKKSAS